MVVNFCHSVDDSRARIPASLVPADLQAGAALAVAALHMLYSWQSHCSCFQMALLIRFVNSQCMQEHVNTCVDVYGRCALPFASSQCTWRPVCIATPLPACRALLGYEMYQSSYLYFGWLRGFLAWQRCRHSTETRPIWHSND